MQTFLRRVIIRCICDNKRTIGNIYTLVYVIVTDNKVMKIFLLT